MKTRDELNDILSKVNIEDCYLAILERREKELTTDEYRKLVESGIDYGSNEEKVAELEKAIGKNKKVSKFHDEIMSALFSIAKIRCGAILTIVDGEVYNISTLDDYQVDLKKEKIITYENLNNYNTDGKAKIRICDKKDSPRIKRPTVLVDGMDKEADAWFRKHRNDQSDVDVDYTRIFLEEYKRKIMRKASHKKLNLK